MKVIRKFIRRSIFVDTNAFIYFLTGTCNDLALEIFRMGFRGKLKLITSTRVVDELLFKMVLLRAKERFGLEKKTLMKLRKDKERVKELSNDCQTVQTFLRKSNVSVLDVKRTTLDAIPEIMRKHGVFGNDALTIKLMRENNLKYILTSDTDFETLEEIQTISPITEP